MNERLERFTTLLKQIFELDKSDLDFGIYRVMNLRKVEVENFLKNRLPQLVQETLVPFANDDKEKTRQQITEIEKTAADFGLGPESLPEDNPIRQKYAELQRKLLEGADLAALETDVYSALYSFFNRYYEDGDFISKRRYREGVYSIPYEGEEVKLYWANHDQYYIKSSENFKDYSFTFDETNVHFRLVNATSESANNKEYKDSKRTFMLFEEDEENFPELSTFEYNSNNREMIVRFTYDIPKDKKKKYAEENYASITKWILSLRRPELNTLIAPVSNGKNKDTSTLLEKHLKAYVAKNTFDYFIHKDLRGFLYRELDFYIKSEIMHLDDLDTANEVRVETYLAKIKAIKNVGKIIINFLAQIEDFQKKLWTKKKFVIEAQWYISLDKVNQSFWSEITHNSSQINEWISLYNIDNVEGWSIPPTNEFLERNQNLIIDTKHFSEAFKQKLQESINNIDEETTGILIHSDNYQALNFLNKKYEDSIQLIYIDPPYNTDASKILYKNGYEHSSWISLLESRLVESRKLLSRTGIIQVAIDDYEMRYLNTCMDQIFGINNAISNIAILTNPKGRDQGFIAQAHDYTLMYAKNKSYSETHNFILTNGELAKKYSKTKDGSAHRELPLKRTGSDKYREDRQYMYFPFFYSPEKNDLLVIPKELYIKIYDADTDTFNDAFLENVITEYKKKGYSSILPLSSKGEKFRWRWGYSSSVRGVKDGTIFCKRLRDGGYAIYQYDLANEEAAPKSLWFGERYDASSKGTNLLEHIVPQNPFDFPKSLYTVEDNIIIGSDSDDIVLDYFAGSGTTGHAVIDLNRKIEHSNRKFILVEMGDHFYSVIIPRLKRVAYSSEWKNGKPQDRSNGISQIVKYMRLEGYEDSLSNIKLDNNNGQLAALLGDDYLIHYMVNLESKGSLLELNSFINPFAYTMKITEKNESKDRIIDICESFNYLIGLKIIRNGAMQHYDCKPSKEPKYEGAVDLIITKTGNYSFRQIEGILPDGRTVLVIWRIITDNILDSNAALDAYFNIYRKDSKDRQFDIIFVNGDNNLEGQRASNEHWKVQLIESEFINLMFEEV